MTTRSRRGLLAFDAEIVALAPVTVRVTLLERIEPDATATVISGVT
jgi:hypothetical protein